MDNNDLPELGSVIGNQTGGAAVDARPSDAVNLAAVTGAPVSVASELLDLPTGPRQPA